MTPVNSPRREQDDQKKIYRLPDWLRQMDGAEEIPEWLSKLCQTDEIWSEPEPAPAQEPAVPSAEKPATDWLGGMRSGFAFDDEQMPEWMTEEGQAAEMPAFTAGSQDGIESWLSAWGQTPDTGDQTDLPDWIAGMVPDQPTETPTQAQPPADFSSDEQAILADWLSAAAPAEPAQTISAPPAPVPGAPETELPDWLSESLPAEEESALPDWMSRLGEFDATEPEAAPTEKESALPDWMSQLGQPETTPAPGAPALGAPETELPDWLSESLPAEEESALPDWISRLGMPDTAEPETAPAEEESALPDWMSQLGQPETTPAPGAPALSAPAPGAPETELPDWLSESLPAEEESALPDWMSRLGEFDTAEPETAPAEKESALPDWMSQLGQPETTPAPGAPETELPDWLSESLPAEEESALPDWMSRLGQPETTPAPGAPALSAPETELPDWLSESLPAEEESALPDWMSRLGEFDTAEPETAPAEKESALPDWMSQLGQPETTPAPGAPALSAPETELPDWLSRLSEPGTAEPETAPAPVQVIEPATAEREKFILPDWLPGVSEQDIAAAAWIEPTLPNWLPGRTTGPAISPIQVALPDWLFQVAPLAEPPAEPEPPEEALPDWLSDQAQAFDTTAQPSEPALPGWLSQAAEPETQADTSDWLKSLGQITSAGPAPERQGVTDWLHSISETPTPVADTGEAVLSDMSPDWLQEFMSTESGFAVEPDQTPESAPTLPDWLQEISLDDQVITIGDAPQPPPPKPQMPAPVEATRLQAERWEEEILPTAAALEEETPAWIEDLRRVKSGPEDADLPTETSGPLAGLRGLLNPELIVAMFPKSVYRPLQPTPSAHLAEAALVEQVLSIPADRPVPIKSSDEKKVLTGLGRWLLYILIAGMMLIAAFLPPDLHNLIRPPVTAETQSFYHTLNNLSSGDQALLVIDFDARLEGELLPQTRATVAHLVHQQVGMVIVAMTPPGAVLAQEVLQENGQAISGQHYIHLGYWPPHPASLHLLTHQPFHDIRLFDQTIRAEQTRLGQQISRFDDLDAVIVVSDDQEHIRWWIEQVGSRHPVPILAAVSASMSPWIQPYYSAEQKQVQGMLIGLSGAAAYEALLSGQASLDYAQNNLVLQGYGQLALAAWLIVILLIGGLRSMARKKA